MLRGESNAYRVKILGGEFNDPSTMTANHVIVRPITECNFVIGMPYIKPSGIENPRSDQERKGSVNRGLAHPMTSLPEHVEHLLRFEMLAKGENGFQDLTACTRTLDLLGSKVVHECPANGLATVHDRGIAHDFSTVPSTTPHNGTDEEIMRGLRLSGNDHRGASSVHGQFGFRPSRRFAGTEQLGDIGLLDHEVSVDRLVVAKLV